MRVTSPAVTIKDIWDALVADYGVAASYGLLLETNLDGKVSEAKADVSALATADALTAAKAVIDAIVIDTAGINGDAMRGTDSALLAASYTPERGTDNALLAASYAERGTDNALLAASYTAERGTDSAALASAWTAALATALGSYTAAKAAFLDVAISSRLSTAAYTAERGTDNGLLAANYKTPCFKWKQPAVHSQVSPSGYYTVLDTTTNVRLLYIVCRQAWTGNRTFLVRLTVDGRTYTESLSIVQNTDHYAYLNPTYLGAEELVLSTDRHMVIDQDCPLEGQSVKVEVACDVPSTYYHYAAVYYESLT